MSGVRLDQKLVELGHFESREKARATIMSGLVFVNGQRADKPGMAVKDDAKVEVRGAACPYVSRGGFKLEKALRVFPISPEGLTCIDCGASTGGFTDVLLKNGAAKVYAVDVGYGQLAWSLRSDSRVVVMERTNARALTPDMFPELMDMAVMDLSFISVRLVLPAVYAAQVRRPGRVPHKAPVRGRARGRGQKGRRARRRCPRARAARLPGGSADTGLHGHGPRLFARARTGGQHRISRISQKGQL